MADPAQLQASVNAWREEAGAIAPVPLLLAEQLLARAANEREAVARALYKKVDTCLQQRPGLEEHTLQTNATGEAESPFAPLLAALRGEQRPQAAPLSKLDRQLQDQNSKLLGDAPPEPAPSSDQPGGLRAASHFQQSRLRHAKHRKVRIALEQRPENPGPLNPHMLAVKILSEIQAVSPAYLERLVSYMDALHSLQYQRGARKRKSERSNRGKSRK